MNKQHHPYLFILLETHTTVEYTQHAVRGLGSNWDCFFVAGFDGTILAWELTKAHITPCMSDTQFLHGVITVNSFSFLLICIYVTSLPSTHENIWRDFEKLKTNDYPWALMGDLNYASNWKTNEGWGVAHLSLLYPLSRCTT